MPATSSSGVKIRDVRKATQSPRQRKPVPRALKGKHNSAFGSLKGEIQLSSSPPLNSSSKTATSSAAILKDALLDKIDHDATLSVHRKRVYRALLSIPLGRWTTYTALSEHLGTGPRAVGNANRTNPFAPDVPCHRVLAADRTIGKYQGDWPSTGGKYQVEKRRLLEGEGIVFDERGRAYGDCFRDFDKMDD